jgi:hypothetical protein
MTSEVLYPVFIGAVLAAIGIIVLGAGLVPHLFRPRKPHHRAPALALTGVILIASGIWLLRAMS